MGRIDKRGRLEEQEFSYRCSKDGTVFISWKGRVVTTLTGEKCRKLQSQLLGADERGQQLLLAKATGHFKHGNER
jgi:hypothetical protein